MKPYPELCGNQAQIQLLARVTPLQHDVMKNVEHKHTIEVNGISSTSNLISYFTISGNPSLIMFLAGNKADLEEKRKVGLEVVTFQYYSLLFSFSVPLDILGEDT